MHGLIHILFKDFIVEKFGTETWAKILAKCGVEDDSLILDGSQQYEDSLTFAAVEAGVEILGVSKDMAMELFGEYFQIRAIDMGFKRMLHSMGSDLQELMTNLNEMHHALERDFRQSKFPFFETAPYSTPGTFLLTYKSARFLPALVKGVVKGISRTVLSRRVDLEEVDFEQRSISNKRVTNLEQQSISKNKVTWIVKDLGPYLEEKAEEKASVETTTGYDFCSVHGAFVSLFSCLPAECCGPPVRPLVVDDQKHGDEELVPLHCVSDKRERVGGQGVWEECHEKGSKVARLRAEYDIPGGQALPDWVKTLGRETRLNLAVRLVRSVSASRVAAPWPKVEELEASSKNFWQPRQRLPEYFDWSSPVVEGLLLRFVSHCWDAPGDWAKFIGDKSSYTDFKAAELCVTLKDLAAAELGDAKKWGEVGLWIDKSCIYQKEPEFLFLNVLLIEEFLQLCGGLVVLCSWSYFSRLWCVYEWACFLVFHEPEDVILCIDAFYRPNTELLYLEAVRDFQVAKCQCFSESDREVLTTKIQDYYGSEANFEHFLKFTVIALCGRSLARRHFSSSFGLQRWVELAEASGFDDLATALKLATPDEWWSTATKDDVVALSGDVQTTIRQLCEEWFQKEVKPLIQRERKKRVHGHVLERMDAMRLSIKSLSSSHTPADVLPATEHEASKEADEPKEAVSKPAASSASKFRRWLRR